MKKVFFLAGLIMVGQSAFAQSNDSMPTYRTETAVIVATRATDKTPIAFSTLDKKEIEARNFGQDIPYMLQMQPSVVVTSDAGAGVGYTGLRIRGTDATRINVTANGIPMNDAESHSLFWVNTPDLASSLRDIQIQRGAGTSTNGAGAFGGSVNMSTEMPGGKPYSEISTTYGSFNTGKQTVKVGSGLIGRRWAFDARLSNIHSDGYRKRGSTDMQSYFAQGVYYGYGTTVRFIAFGGKEKTYHAWDAISAGTMKEDRRYNPSGEIENADGDVTGFYKDQTDNYLQNNFQIHLSQRIAGDWHLRAALHYTKGDGYYEEYKNGQSLAQYGLPSFRVVTDVEGIPTDTEVSRSNLVRRKMMDNYFGGGVFSLSYNGDKLQAVLGGALNKYDGDHMGRVIWLQNYAGSLPLDPRHEYYNNNGTKVDGNLYLKASWEAFDDFYLFGDLQYRGINYRIDGANDKWDWTAGAMQRLDVDTDFNFFNPKGGIFYRINDKMNVYGSVAIANREPTRNNYTDAKTDVPPRSERLTDYELGFVYRDRVFTAGLNLYYMKYKDQLVPTGEVNHIGELLADNVPDSYRTGVELAAGVQFAQWLRWDGNLTLSRNRIKNYTDYVTVYDENWDVTGQVAEKMGDTPISYSPDVTAASLFGASFGNFTAAFQSNYVGMHYVTNSGEKQLSLSDYFVNDLRLGYTFETRTPRSIHVGLAVNNIFDRKYSSNGYGWSSMFTTSPGKAYDMYYFPQAGINFLASLTVKF